MLRVGIAKGRLVRRAERVDLDSREDRLRPCDRDVGVVAEGGARVPAVGAQTHVPNSRHHPDLIVAQVGERGLCDDVRVGVGVAQHVRRGAIFVMAGGGPQRRAQGDVGREDLELPIDDRVGLGPLEDQEPAVGDRQDGVASLRGNGFGDATSLGLTSDRSNAGLAVREDRSCRASICARHPRWPEATRSSNGSAAI
jgi:hypothetical protein